MIWFWYFDLLVEDLEFMFGFRMGLGLEFVLGIGLELGLRVPLFFRFWGLEVFLKSMLKCLMFELWYFGLGFLGLKV